MHDGFVNHKAHLRSRPVRANLSVVRHPADRDAPNAEHCHQHRQGPTLPTCGDHEIEGTAERPAAFHKLAQRVAKATNRAFVSTTLLLRQYYTSLVVENVALVLGKVHRHRVTASYLRLSDNLHHEHLAISERAVEDGVAA